jgi:Family of unknown function (DUF5924)
MLDSWRALHDRYARWLWGLHSAWALLSGIAVLVLAHNRYGFLKWVVLFIALTWGSTLVFSRLSGLARTVVSYLTRVMYQETLFFLLPFYFYSTTFRSWNVLYLVVLAALAVLSCFDLLFDRLLREHRWFGIGFFAFVSFSALQFFLPLVLRWHIDNGELLAAAIAFVAAIALAQRWAELRQPKRLGIVLVALAAVLGALHFVRPLLPPVPLRLTRVRVAGTINPRGLASGPDFAKDVPMTALRRGRLYAVATVFSPQRIPARVQMRFVHAGKVLRTSRNLEVTARPGGFRIWDSVRLPETNAAGVYRIEVWTGGQLLGVREVRVYSRAAPSSRLRSLSNVPSGRWPALRAISRIRQSEKPTDGGVWAHEDIGVNGPHVSRGCTARSPGESSILVNVHPGLLRRSVGWHSQIHRSRPGGQLLPLNNLLRHHS